jgi:hypothetical protein
MSEDLKTWHSIDSGTLPGNFTDPDATIFSQKYYRAQIE